MDAIPILIEAVGKIPATFWGVVSGAVIALVGVVASNFANTKRLEKQLTHDRTVKKAERDFSTKRDIYFEATDAISLALRSLLYFAYLHQTNDEIMKDYLAKAGALAKVQLIGSPQTIKTLNGFSIFMGNAVLQLSVMRAPLLGERSAILVEETSVNNAQKDFDNVMDAYKQFNFSGALDLQESQRMQRNSEMTLERVNGMRDKLSTKTTALNLKAMAVYKEAIRLHVEATNLLPSLVEAIRAELDLPIDSGFLGNLQTQANLEMLAMSEKLDAMSQAKSNNV
jgi:hypothetical protein